MNIQDHLLQSLFGYLIPEVMIIFHFFPVIELDIMIEKGFPVFEKIVLVRTFVFAVHSEDTQSDVIERIVEI